MEAAVQLQPHPHPNLILSSQNPSFPKPIPDRIKRKLLQKGVFPTPKIIHTLRKKETLKSIRRSKRLASDQTPFSESQKQELEEESQFRDISLEYRTVRKALGSREKNEVSTFGMPWEGVKATELREMASGSGEYGGDKLRREGLVELRALIEERKWVDLRWVLEVEDGDVGEGSLEGVAEREEGFRVRKTAGNEDDAIRLLAERLGTSNLSMRDWKFSRLINQSGIQFTERHLLKMVERLGALGHWKHALSVVEWVYNGKDYKHYKSRFVYTKLLSVLGKARRPREALQIFNTMREDRQIYPDMPAYHSIAVTLGQAGLLKELLGVIECMKKKPSKNIKNMYRKKWDPCLEPDLVIFNSVLNACVPCKQWKGVFWVLEQIRHSGMKPNGATYGLAMEVMLKSAKYDLVHKFFGKMKRSGLAPKALTYKVLVKALWEEGKVNEAIEAVRDMEQRGVVGTASVYYELACCLCYHGRWQEAIGQVEKLKKVSLTKPLEVAFTGMIQSCMDGGHVNDCISIFEQMKDYCIPNTGTINAMLKVYGRNDMFAKAKELFEETKKYSGFNTHLSGGTSLTPDEYSYVSILEASASAHQWEYFEHVYKEMTLCSYQLDQNKHAWILVEASKAGKWHLLEHAFDTILEGGEIPHLSLFTEMILQNIAWENYERAVALVNGMAHTSLQISEKQWIDIFRKNQNRIGEDELQKLLAFLHGSNAMTEAIVSNLLASLQHFCGSSSLKDSSKVMRLSDENDWNANKTKMQCHFPDVADGNHNSNGDVLDTGYDCDPSLFLVPCTDDNDNEVDDLVLNAITHVSNESLTSSLHGFQRDNADNVEPDISARCAEDSDPKSIHHGQFQNDLNDMTGGLLISHNDESDGGEIPSASEILEAWREKRSKDGVFSFEI